MIEYIYFVKCPGCEDEMFHFFDEAKEFALSSMTKKPVITQIEVHRNDFGECVDSFDLGTVWSYEQMMSDIPDATEETVFSKSETFNTSDWDVAADLAGFTDDVEGYDFITKDPIKKRPLPAEMTIEALIEEMEEFEDMVECKECYDLKPKSDCKYEEGRGYVCAECSSRSVKEAVAKTPETVELCYDDLEITIFGEKRDADDWDEKEVTVDFVYEVEKNDVATFMYESCLTEEDIKDVPGGFDTLDADDAAWENFINNNFDILFEKYEKQILDYYREAATEKCQENTTWDDYFACDESVNKEAMKDASKEKVAFEYEFETGQYEDAKVTRYIHKVSKEDVEETLFEFVLADDDFTELSYDREELSEDRALYNKFFAEYFDKLVNKYYENLLNLYEDAACEAAAKEAEDDYMMGGYDDIDDIDEACAPKNAESMLEELEESDDYSKRLAMCPECGATSFDHETGICINCGFNVLDEDLSDTDIKNIANITKRIVEKETDELLDRVNEVGNTVSIHHQVISKGLDNLQKEN